MSVQVLVEQASGHGEWTGTACRYLPVAITKKGAQGPGQVPVDGAGPVEGGLVDVVAGEWRDNRLIATLD
jgi:hypothetical protein